MSIVWCLLLLALVACAVASSIHSEICPPRHVRCNCGNRKGRVLVPFKRCLRFDGYDSYCDDCIHHRQWRKKICRQFKECASCSADSCTSCPPNRKGRWCNEDCSQQCENHGTCVRRTEDNATCLCPAGFRGQRCEIVEDKECKIVTKPANGNVSVHERTATYSCDPGYSLYGQKVLVCQPDGTWSSEAPVCDPECVMPNATEHLSFSRQELYEEDGREDVVVKLQARCDDGYRVVGARAVYCNLNGTWSSLPRCVKRGKCHQPNNIENGQFTTFSATEDYYEGTEVTYQCNVNYVIEGSFSLVCKENGEWTASPPRCIEQDVAGEECPDPDDLQNGKIVPGPESSVKKYVPGVRIVYRCNDGYVLHPSQSNRFCNHNGTWKPDAPPRCIKVDTCGDPGFPANGKRCFGKSCSESDISTFSSTCPIRVDIEGEVVILPEGMYPTGSYLGFKCKSDYYTLDGDAFIKCEEEGHWTSPVPQCVPKCGHEYSGYTGLIYRGSESLGENWPWHVVLKGRKTLCGGVLIGESWVVTVAHCVPKDGHLTAEFGRKDLNSTHDQDIQTRKIPQQNMHTHSDFDPRTFDNDIALLRVEPPLEISSLVQPVCLIKRIHTGSCRHGTGNNHSQQVPSCDSFLSNANTPNFSKNLRSYVTGFGNTMRHTPGNSQQLQHAKVNVVSNNTWCTQYLRKRNTTISVKDNMFCAGGEMGEHPCKGDSGSPLITEQQHHRKPLWYLHGLVSWGPANACTKNNAYGVFTNVTTYYGWIQEITTPALMYYNRFETGI